MICRHCKENIVWVGEKSTWGHTSKLHWTEKPHKAKPDLKHAMDVAMQTHAGAFKALEDQ